MCGNCSDSSKRFVCGPSDDGSTEQAALPQPDEIPVLVEELRLPDSRRPGW